MNVIYTALTNNDLFKEITKWHVLKYIQYPDIFLDLISHDDNLFYLQWLLENKYTTISTLNDIIRNVYDKRSIAYHPGNQAFGKEVLNHFTINTFVEYVLLYTKSFKIFMYIFKNFNEDREIILNSGILRGRDAQYFLRSNLNGFDKKMDLVRIYQFVGMLPEQLPIVNRHNSWMHVPHETSLYQENDIIIDVIWKTRDKDEIWEEFIDKEHGIKKEESLNTKKRDSIFKCINSTPDKSEHPEESPTILKYNPVTKYANCKHLCDRPDENCNIIVNNFGDFIKLIQCP